MLNEKLLEKKTYCKVCYQATDKNDAYKKYKKTFDAAGVVTQIILPIYDEKLYQEILKDQEKLAKSESLGAKTRDQLAEEIVGKMVTCFKVKADQIYYFLYPEMSEHNFCGFMVRNKKEGFGISYAKWIKVPTAQDPTIFNYIDPVEYHRRRINQNADQQQKVNQPGYEGVFRLGNFHTKSAKIFNKDHLIYEGGFNMGKKEGPGTTYYFETGKLKSIATWKNDEYHGKSVKVYFRNGQLNSLGNYQNGKPYGFFRVYHESGKISYHGMCDLRKNKKYDEFYNTEEPHDYGIFASNRSKQKFDGLTQEFHINGQFIYIGDKQVQLRHGKGVSFKWNGCLHGRGNFKQGMLDGRKELVYHQGKLKYKGNMRKNRRDGYGKSFDLEGRCVYAGGWQENGRHGKGKIYCENGRVWEVEYVNSRLKWLDEYAVIECECIQCVKMKRRVVGNADVGVRVGVFEQVIREMNNGVNPFFGGFLNLDYN